MSVPRYFRDGPSQLRPDHEQTLKESQCNLLEGYPLTTQGSAWYAGISLTAVLLMAAIALYCFYTSLGGRPVFGGAMLEE